MSGEHQKHTKQRQKNEHLPFWYSPRHAKATQNVRNCNLERGPPKQMTEDAKGALRNSCPRHLPRHAENPQKHIYLLCYFWSWVFCVSRSIGSSSRISQFGRFDRVW